MAETAVGGARYRAFISYSHKDAAFGRHLHRRLESYRLPRRLIGRDAQYGAVPERIGPIFRDLDELPAASDLSLEVREALSASASLVVVCSPSAAASYWVSREVEVFRSLHPARPILAAIVAGEPPDCFPAVLLSAGTSRETIEPLAADFREKRDGSGLALLKLVAGILGLGLDELVQRDAQRKSRRVTAITAAALAAVLVMGALTLFALSTRSEAVRQRSAAEGLIEYMLTDLRDKLKGVGRLDVMAAVNARALRYYSDEDLDRLPADSLERRARVLHAMGEDDEARGDHDGALKKFGEARRTTAALLAQAPDDPDRLFDHAQSEFWLGYVDYNRGRYAHAEQAFLRYGNLARHLIALAPDKTKYRRELSYAENNLCAIALKTFNRGGATRHCADELRATEEVANHPDRDNRTAEAAASISGDLMNALADRADAYRLSGDLSGARAARNEELKILDRALGADPRNMDLRDTWITVQIALARLDEADGNPIAATKRLAATLRSADALYRFDVQNSRSRRLRDYIAKELVLVAHIQTGERNVKTITAH
jgi:tetratricopeptide (TPR) repeat protein